MKKKCSKVLPKTSRVFSIRLEEDSISQLRAIAEERGSNGISFIIRKIVKQFLQDQINKPTP
jgi:metal-responsive CopG/Arc/MetJ family transcriptional regulator